MRYEQFRQEIENALLRETGGLTWIELRDRCGLPYDRPCPTWTRMLEDDIGLVRQRLTGRSLTWSIPRRRRRG